MGGGRLQDETRRESVTSAESRNFIPKVTKVTLRLPLLAPPGGIGWTYTGSNRRQREEAREAMQVIRQLEAWPDIVGKRIVRGAVAAVTVSSLSSLSQSVAFTSAQADFSRST